MTFYHAGAIGPRQTMRWVRKIHWKELGRRHRVYPDRTAQNRVPGTAPPFYGPSCGGRLTYHAQGNFRAAEGAVMSKVTSMKTWCLLVCSLWLVSCGPSLKRFSTTRPIAVALPNAEAVNSAEDRNVESPAGWTDFYLQRRTGGAPLPVGDSTFLSSALFTASALGKATAMGRVVENRFRLGPQDTSHSEHTKRHHVFMLVTLLMTAPSAARKFPCA